MVGQETISISNQTLHTFIEQQIYKCLHYKPHAKIARLIESGGSELHDKNNYYSTITSFYHIRTRERAKYESVLHCSKRIAL